MKYQVLKSCVINNQPAPAGSIVEVDGDQSRALLSMGRIMPYDEPKVENRSVGLDESDEQPKRRGRPKKNG